jgi:hypothetical protein
LIAERIMTKAANPTRATCRVFRVSKSANYGSYTTAKSNANFGKPTLNANVAYQARIVQLGFRFAF